MTRTMLVFAAGTLVIGLTGCGYSTGLSLTPEEDDLPACTDLSTVLVENLPVDRSDCNLAGASLTFPDGRVVEMDAFGGSGSASGGLSEYEYGWVNVGDFGVVAGWHADGCSRSEVWGSAEGKRRVFEAFGENWPCEG